MRITNKFQSKLILPKFSWRKLKTRNCINPHGETESLPTEAANWVTCFLTNGGKYLSTHSEYVTTQVSILWDVTGRQWPTTKLAVYFLLMYFIKNILVLRPFLLQEKKKKKAVPNITTNALNTFLFWLIVPNDCHPTGSSDRFNYKCSAECTAELISLFFPGPPIGYFLYFAAIPCRS